MKPSEALQAQLRGLDGQDYGAYQSLKGAWRFPDFELYLDRIPKDPYAPPGTGVYRARVSRSAAGFPPALLPAQGKMDSTVREIALRDFLARRFFAQCAAINKGRRGTGNSGVITIAEPGQEILERTSMVLAEDHIEARFSMSLPAQGRKVRAGIAAEMLCEELPEIVRSSLFNQRVDGAALEADMVAHLAAAEDSAYLRERLEQLGLVAFIADGARLPRKSGVENLPLDAALTRPFRSPESLRVRVELPNGGACSGMGIPRGVTLIVGGGYHGKSTLLQALELGVYDHIPGDGRENCVALAATVKVRAFSGRGVSGTDISAFIGSIPGGIPGGGDTASFSTGNASGSTSQAAFIAESVEAGAQLLLMDEDTCATNFMIRDKRMQELVAKEHEPITAFVDRVRQLYEQHGVSTILVMGGSGDYFSAADCVIHMKEYTPHEVTAEARAIAERFSTGRAPEGGPDFALPRRRCPLAAGLDPRNEFGHFRIQAPATRQLIYGDTRIDLSDVEQLVETAQTKAIGRALQHMTPAMDGRHGIREIAHMLRDDLRAGGLDILDGALVGDLAAFRPLEFIAALNRIRGLRFVQDEER